MSLPQSIRTDTVEQNSYPAQKESEQEAVVLSVFVLLDCMSC